jgi:hypothetical protein
MTRFCLTKTQVPGSSQFFPRLSPINSWSNFPVVSQDILVFSTAAICSEYSALYAYIPYNSVNCIIGYQNPFPNSLPICEIFNPQVGYYYIKCYDMVAIATVLQQNCRLTFIGYFEANVPTYSQQWTQITTTSCMVNGNDYAAMAFFVDGGFPLTPTYNGNTFSGYISQCFEGGSSPWWATFYGLSDFPNTQYINNTIIGSQSSTSNGNTFIINNCDSDTPLSFSLGDLVQTQSSLTQAIQYSTSSQTAYTQSITLTFNQGTAGIIQATQAFQLGFTQTETSSNQYTGTNNLAYTDTLNVGGNMIAAAGTKYQVVELLSNQVDIIQHNIIINSQMQNVVQENTQVNPAGFTVIKLTCP